MTNTTKRDVVTIAARDLFEAFWTMMDDDGALSLRRAQRGVDGARSAFACSMGILGAEPPFDADDLRSALDHLERFQRLLQEYSGKCATVAAEFADRLETCRLTLASGDEATE